jgi:hypothetical protein
VCEYERERGKDIGERQEKKWSERKRERERKKYRREREKEI